jgi:hypothetical protein
VFFFDEAHLLFNEAPKALVERIELVVRLVRSKGVGVYFVTQNPLDIPDSVLAQLGNRVQHALRAFTPRDQKAVKAAASTMRANPGSTVETAITELPVGEALISLLDEKGRPCRDRARVRDPPGSQIGPITPEQRTALIAGSLVAGRLREDGRPRSAYEKLKGRAAASPTAALAPRRARRSADRHGEPAGGPAARRTRTAACSAAEGRDLRQHRPARRQARRAGRIAAASAMRSIGSSVGREIIRGVLGSILGGKRR